MISLKRCREVLDPKNKKFTDDDLLAIRDFLTTMAEIDVELFLKSQQDEKSSGNVQS